MNLRISSPYLFGMLFGAFLFGFPQLSYSAPKPEPVVWDQLFEEILTVQDNMIDAKALAQHDSKKSALSIPYTRVDLVIRNGIAFTRLLQIYHNHSDKNEGYAFALPTSMDTHITQFNLWDRGERYIGAIEERTKAEDTYRKITGDETPTMNVDPGLVRKTFNRFEMRVFPIYPGENKQVELITHQRLQLDGEDLSLTLPLQALLTSSDSRHPTAVSEKTEINIRIADDLPIDNVTFTGHTPQELKRGARHTSHSLQIAKDKTVDLTIAYRLKVPNTPSVTQLTFEDQGEQFFALRILRSIDQERLKKKMQEAAKANSEQMKLMGNFGSAFGEKSKEKLTIPKPDKPPFYFAVWRKPTEKQTSSTMPDLDLELAGYQTFMLINKKRFFHASWLTNDMNERGSEESSYFSILTDQPYPNPYWMLPLSKGMETVRERSRRSFTKDGKPAAPKVKADNTYDTQFNKTIAHLSGAIKKDKCPYVFLFLEDLGAERFSAISKKIAEYPQAVFLLVTKKDVVPAVIRTLNNVSLFSIENGWLKNDHFPSKQQLLITSENQQSFAALGVPLHVATLRSMWNRLPEIDPQAAQWTTTGNVQFSDVYYLNGATLGNLGRTNFESRAGETSSRSLVWLVGRYSGTGKSRLRLQFPHSSMPSIGMGMFSSLATIPSETVETTVELPKANSTLRFVGSFVGSAEAADLDAKIRMRTIRRGRQIPEKLNPKTEAEVANLRKEVVELSRRFSFISNETAFIALPEKLREEHGIEAQRFEMGQLYGSPNEIDPTVIPEPGTFLLLLTALTGLLLLYLHRSPSGPYRHHHSYVQHTSSYK